MQRSKVIRRSLKTASGKISLDISRDGSGEKTLRICRRGSGAQSYILIPQENSYEFMELVIHLVAELNRPGGSLRERRVQRSNAS